VYYVIDAATGRRAPPGEGEALRVNVVIGAAVACHILAEMSVAKLLYVEL
jgi:hypothetical protein